MKNACLVFSALLCLSAQIAKAQKDPSAISLQALATNSAAVHFADVIHPAKAYGSTVTDIPFDAKKDLNRDNKIDFQDFILFADQFGQSASMGMRWPTSASPHTGALTDAHIVLHLQPSATPNQVTLTIALNQPYDIAAYCLALQYDATALQLMRAESAHPSQFAPHNSQLVALQALGDQGQIILADAFAEPLPEEGQFLSMTFRITNPNAPPQIRIAQVLLADSNENIYAVQGAHLDDINTTPQTLTLRQNYPNPFNPSTEITYELPDSGKVSLIIYNLLGQEVRRLIDTAQNPGAHRASWDGTDAQGHPVSSGVYLYRLSTEKSSQTRMMMLLK